MRRIIILENIRSAYNVGNCIRTADALGREVWLTGYSPSPLDNPKVKKTSLGAEEHVGLTQFDYTEDAIQKAQELGLETITAEIIPEAIPLNEYQISQSAKGIAVIFGNEVEGVLPQSLKNTHTVVFIPMQGIKESLNIGQSSAIFMRALRDK